MTARLPNTAEFGLSIEGIALIGQVKETLAVDLKIAFENEQVAIPRDRDLTSQIHSIKKTPTEAGYARFDTEKNERHRNAITRTRSGRWRWLFMQQDWPRNTGDRVMASRRPLFDVWGTQ